MSAKRTLTPAAALGLGILLLIPIAGSIWAPLRTSEVMGGRMMVWGLLWLLAVVLAVLVLLAIGAAASWRRLRR